MQFPFDRVEAWMDERGLGSGPISDVRPLAGGTQNVMVRLSRDGRDYVLRRGPEHLRPLSNKVIAREFEVLGALESTDVPHPRLVASCGDASVLDGAVFYLMEPVDGFNAGEELPDAAAGDPGKRRALALSMVDALASLGEVDHVAVGLAGFGRPEGFLDRQVGRWLAELRSYQELNGYRGPQIGDVIGVAAWLDERVPETWRPGIMHGDFHACNVMFRRTEPVVAAIVDWEMCTIGDPLLDLGWLVATWDLPGAPAEFAGLLTRAGGLPTADELVERYARRTSRDLANLQWYVVLACFKLGIILEGSNARADAGLAPRDVGDRLHATTVRLFERAHELMNGER